MTSRRSFLAAVMGAVAAPVAAKLAPSSRQSLALQKFDAVWAKLKEVCYRYTVWDSLTISPGAVVDERLLPPPGPSDFLIDAIGVHVNDASDYKAVAEVARGVVLNLKDGPVNLLEAPLNVFGDGMAATRLARPYRFQRSDLGLYLNSQGIALRSESRVTVSVILQGIVFNPEWK